MTRKEMERIGRLFKDLPAGDQQKFADWLRQEPASAQSFITEAAHALMAAKCIATSPADGWFHQQCAGLLALSLRYPDVGILFRELARIDSSTPDPMLEPAMIGLARARINVLGAVLG